MNAGDGDTWKQDLELLRAKIEELEREQRKALAGLRAQLWDLETAARQPAPGRAAPPAAPALSSGAYRALPGR